MSISLSPSLTPNPKFTALDANGDPCVGGKLYTYKTGTTTPKTTWTDKDMGTPNTNPVVLNNRGQADVWLDVSSESYRFKLTDLDDVVIWTVDNVSDVFHSIKEGFNYYESVFSNFCTTWSDTNPAVIFPKKTGFITKVADYTVTAADVIVDVDASGMAVIITLEPAATAGIGRIVGITCSDATNAIVINGDGAETIGGQTTMPLENTGEALLVVSDGSNWGVLAHKQYSLSISYGGTGLDTMTDHGILLGSGTDPITLTAEMSDGQLLVGDTEADPAPKSPSGLFTMDENGVATAEADSVNLASLAADAKSGMVKGYVSFHGSNGAIYDSYNVDTLVDVGVGQIRVNWDTEPPAINYIAVASASDSAAGEASVFISVKIDITAYVMVYTRNQAGDAAADPYKATLIGIW